MSRFFAFVSFLTLTSILFSCGGPRKDDVIEVPTDLPDICKGIDFVSQPDMREVCGVRSTRYQSYKNIPMQRYLINPKGASLVRTNSSVELRLPNTLPIPLPSAISSGIEFNQEKRLEYIKNTMIYKELFPAGQERIKMFKLGVPMDQGGAMDLCFNLPESKSDDRKRSRMGTRIESLDCSDFDNIVAKYGK